MIPCLTRLPLTSQHSASAIFINARNSEQLVRKYSIRPRVIALDLTTLTLETFGAAYALSAGLAAAAARMTGLVACAQLVSAMREEFSYLHIPKDVIEKNVVVADKVFDLAT